MKKLFVFAALIAMPVFANPPAATNTAPATEAVATEAAKPVEAAKTAAHDVKKGYKEAKAECQKDGLKGADLKKCIKEKTKH